LGNTSHTDHTNNTGLIGSGMSTTLSNIMGIGRSDQNVIIGATNVTTDNGNRLQVNGSESVTGKTFLGGSATPTATLHLSAGTAAAGTAPVKLTAGTVLATPEDGTIEYDGTDLFLTQSSTRYKLSKTLTGQLTTSFGGAAVSAGNTVTAAVSVPGAQPGDVVAVSANTGAVNPPSVIITAYVTTTDSVTLQAYNSSGSTVTLASDTYKVRVIR
ncbi:MAG: hypothetical protein JST39_13815, partial [Bacteroidetes bacterium]|nr:hypothetical protein [Bacteroidota bacterium]